MSNHAFMKVVDPQRIELKVAITQTSTIIPFDVWDHVRNRDVERVPYDLESLDTKPLEQLHKVYADCIHPQQYLPQLFTEENSELILQAGPHCSEQILPYEYYTDLGGAAVPQHCRYVGEACMYFL